MKKVYILGIMLCACTLFNSCNDEWKEELHAISLMVAVHFNYR